VKAGPPERADIALVLAGDGYGHRILKGAELVRAGYVPGVLVSGPAGYYGRHECDLAIPFAVQKGYPREWFIPFPHDAKSTAEEARVTIPELRRRGVRKFLLVTSDYHTRRAGRTFGPLLGTMEMKVIASPDEYFDPDRWWKSRSSQKAFFFEWSKTVAAWVGL
jgi:uncharacterized SAM-binding protein YcdF (DUF218 family)